MLRVRLTMGAAAIACVIVACSSFSGDTSPPADADSGPPINDDGGRTDAIAIPDAGASDAADAGAPNDGPCAVDRLVVGYNTAPDSGVTASPTFTGWIDSYGFDVPEAARVACVRVFIDTGTATLPIALGVYANDPTTKAPGARLAKANLVDAFRVGWNAAVLEPPIDLTQGQRVWIAVGAKGGSLPLRIGNKTCDDKGRVRHSATMSDPQAIDPAGYTQPSVDGCDLLAYLSP